jgi:hypothetical protein
MTALGPGAAVPSRIARDQPAMTQIDPPTTFELLRSGRSQLQKQTSGAGRELGISGP